MGVALARNSVGVVRAIGRGLVSTMPIILRTLALVGTVAMLWVGGGIVLHGLETYGLGAIAHLVHDLAVMASGGQVVIDWLVNTALTSVFGVITGGLLIPVVGKVLVPLWKRSSPAA